MRKEKHNGEDIIKPIAILPNVIELSYYSNSLVTHFALESVVALALSVSEIRLNTVSHEDLMENALELCSILQYEFLFCKPCQNLEQIITSCIDDLTVTKEIFLPEADTNELIQKSRKIASQFDDEEQEEAFQKLYEINTSQAAMDTVKYLANILMPLIEAYAIAGFTLDKLVQRQLLENELVDDVLQEMKSQLGRGSLKYGKCLKILFFPSFNRCYFR